MSGTQENIDAYRHTLLAITELAADGMPTHEQIFAGISYYTHMAHGCAPNSKVAEDTITAGIEYGRRLHEEDMEDEDDWREGLTEDSDAWSAGERPSDIGLYK